MKRRNIITATALIGLLYSIPVFAANEVIGVNSAVKGDVTITDDQAIEREAVIKDKVRMGEEVNSKRLSTLQVLLNDQTVFTVGPDCALTIDEFVYNPATSNNSMSASVKKGMFRFMSGNISKSSSEAVTIESPVASMGIRGTIVEGLVGADAIDIARKQGLVPPGTVVDQEGATIFILRGPGQNSRSDNRPGEIDVMSGGKTVTITQSGMASFVSAEGMPPSDPFMVPDEVYELFSKKLRTQPTLMPKPVQEPIQIEYFDPIADMDWPHSTQGNGGITPGGPSTLPCTPQNPIFPNC